MIRMNGSLERARRQIFLLAEEDPYDGMKDGFQSRLVVRWAFQPDEYKSVVRLESLTYLDGTRR